MSVTKTFESTVITLAEESFLTRFCDASVLSVPGDMFGAEWAGREIPLTEAKRLLMGRLRKPATGCGRTLLATPGGSAGTGAWRRSGWPRRC